MFERVAKCMNHTITVAKFKKRAEGLRPTCDVSRDVTRHLNSGCSLKKETNVHIA